MNTTCTNSSPCAFRAAIACSNMAVSMFERGAYKQALATLKDSVLLMKVASQQQHQQQSSLGRQNQSFTLIETKVRRAARHAANPQACHHANSNTMIRVRALSLDDGIAAYQTIVQEGIAASKSSNVLNCCRPRIVSPIRMDAIDFMCDYKEGHSSCGANNSTNTGDDEAGLEMAIILYNLALAHQCSCWTTSSTSSSNHSKMHEAAQKLLLLAHGILAVSRHHPLSPRSLHQEEAAADETQHRGGDVLQGSKHLLFSQLIASTIIQSMTEMGKTDKAAEFYAWLTYVGEAVDEMQRVTTLLFQGAQAAGAA